mmetsp:Transcript_2535/g.3379  ORF Transcript_2535/g.3379 Transcript_2535/m.3379 type:complete len:127 (-) Transcript_2535:337-717(-)
MFQRVCYLSRVLQRQQQTKYISLLLTREQQPRHYFSSSVRRSAAGGSRPSLSSSSSMHRHLLSGKRDRQRRSNNIGGVLVSVLFLVCGGVSAVVMANCEAAGDNDDKGMPMHQMIGQSSSSSSIAN